MRRLLRIRLRVDHHRTTRGDQAVHAGGRDTDSLLPARHLQAMELRAVQQATEDVLHLLAHDAWSVVDDRDAVARTLRCRGTPRIEILDDDCDIWKDAALLARIERVVDGFLDRRQECLAGIVEAEQVAVLDKELAHGDFLLPSGHLLGSRSPAWLGRMSSAFRHGLHGSLHQWTKAFRRLSAAQCRGTEVSGFPRLARRTDALPHQFSGESLRTEHLTRGALPLHSSPFR